MKAWIPQLCLGAILAGAMLQPLLPRLMLQPVLARLSPSHISRVPACPAPLRLGPDRAMVPWSRGQVWVDHARERKAVSRQPSPLTNTQAPPSCSPLGFQTPLAPGKNIPCITPWLCSACGGEGSQGVWTACHCGSISCGKGRAKFPRLQDRQQHPSHSPAETGPVLHQSSRAWSPQLPAPQAAKVEMAVLRAAAPNELHLCKDFPLTCPMNQTEAAG